MYVMWRKIDVCLFQSFLILIENQTYITIWHINDMLAHTQVARHMWHATRGRNGMRHGATYPLPMLARGWSTLFMEVSQWAMGAKL